MADNLSHSCKVGVVSIKRQVSILDCNRSLENGREIMEIIIRSECSQFFSSLSSSVNIPSTIESSLMETDLRIQYAMRAHLDTWCSIIGTMTRRLSNFQVIKIEIFLLHLHSSNLPSASPLASRRDLVLAISW